jgi:hypothetical protein
VEVVALERVVDEAEGMALGPGAPAAEGVLHLPHHAGLAERGDALSHLEGDEAGVGGGERRSRSVSDPRVGACLATGMGPPSAAGPAVKGDPSIDGAREDLGAGGLEGEEE